MTFTGHEALFDVVKILAYGKTDTFDKIVIIKQSNPRLNAFKPFPLETFYCSLREICIDLISAFFFFFNLFVIYFNEIDKLRFYTVNIILDPLKRFKLSH